MTDPRLDNPPIVLRRRRLDEAMFVVGGSVAVIAAIGFATQTSFRFVGLPLGGIGMAVLLLGVLQIVRPTTMVLEPAGLHYSILGIDRFWPWEDISGFRVVRIRSGRAIVFDVAQPRSRTFAIPGFFVIRPIPLAGLLQHAQCRWAIGGRTTTDPVPLIGVGT
ncbi:hypothetical protein [Sphingomonas sp. PAMC 26605]|uniref:hypothetical protein n=1 Tax=Sphingomonas sp. PAMC 26605 TaxID=1112214 RepID=UPI00056718A7|nr:hypothetical protein [Sphingomonas sp. PAMC 26605]